MWGLQDCESEERSTSIGGFHHVAFHNQCCLMLTEKNSVFFTPPSQVCLVSSSIFPCKLKVPGPCNNSFVECKSVSQRLKLNAAPLESRGRRERIMACEIPSPLSLLSLSLSLSLPFSPSLLAGTTLQCNLTRRWAVRSIRT